MDTIIQSLSLGLLLRCVFAGFFFVISYYTAAHHPDEFSEIKKLDTIQLIPMTLFIGVVAYSVHRSLLYPVIEWFHNTGRVVTLRTKIPLISGATIDSLRRRWDRGANPQTD